MADMDTVARMVAHNNAVELPVIPATRDWNAPTSHNGEGVWVDCVSFWQQGMDRDRIAADNEALRTLFAHTEESATFKAAMDWARAHRVRVIVDHTTTAKGYYTPKTGVVAIAAHTLKVHGDAINTLTHEIRHAWQDYHGLIPSGQSRFETQFGAIAMIEADAFAHGDLAEAEYELTRRNRDLEKRQVAKQIIDPSDAYICEKLGDLVSHPQRTLAEQFERFYTRSEKAALYGSNMLQRTAAALNIAIEGEKPDLKEEFSLKGTKLPARHHPPVDFTRREDFMRLGRGFNTGHSYLADFSRDTAQRVLMSAQQAFTFYAGAKKPGKLAESVRKAQLQKKLSQKRMP